MAKTSRSRSRPEMGRMMMMARMGWFGEFGRLVWAGAKWQ